MRKKIELIETVGDYLVEGFHLVALFVIGATIVWASWIEILKIFQHQEPHIKDVLLLFIYLELGAMVGIYFKTHHMPVRFLIYIAITALTRVLAIDIKTMTDEHLLSITVAILVLSLAVVALRFASHKYPTRENIDT